MDRIKAFKIALFVCPLLIAYGYADGKTDLVIFATFIWFALSASVIEKLG